MSKNGPGHWSFKRRFLDFSCVMIMLLFPFLGNSIMITVIFSVIFGEAVAIANFG